MRRLVSGCWIIASLAMVGLVPLAAEAFGRRGGCCREDCPPPCVVVESKPAEVKYEERKVTYMKPVWRDKVIEETVCKIVPRQEKVVYDVMVPTYRDEKRTVKVCNRVTKEVEETRKVAYLVHGTEKRKVVVNVPVMREEEYTYTCLVPAYRDVKRTVNYCEYETKTVEVTVPVCRRVPEVCTDACGRCYTVCRYVTEHQTVTRNVCVPVTRTKEVVVKECYYEKETRKGVRRVCDYKQEERVVDVPTCTTAYKDVVCKRLVCENVISDREIVVRVCDYVKEKREGVRTVCDRVTEKVSRTVKVCEYETVTEVVRVPVGGCVTPCYDGGGRCGLFGRRRGCCD